MVAERRRETRVKQLSLQSSLGPVIDLSRGGMRVQTTRRLRGEVSVVLMSREGPHVQLRARVAWTKRQGFRRHMAGLEFIDPPESVVQTLKQIGTTGV